MGPTAINKYVPWGSSQLPAASVTCDLWSWAAYSNLVMICPFCRCFTLYMLISHDIHCSTSGIRDSRQASTALCKFQLLQSLNYDPCPFSVGGASTLSGMPSLNHDPESFSRQKSGWSRRSPPLPSLRGHSFTLIITQGLKAVDSHILVFRLLIGRQFLS